MNIQVNRQKFLDSFNLQNNGFINPVFLEDSEIGFSVQKKCDEKIKNKLHITKGKEYITLIYIYIADKELKLLNEKKPLIIRVSFDLIKDGKFHIIKNGWLHIEIDSEVGEWER